MSCFKSKSTVEQDDAVIISKIKSGSIIIDTRSKVSFEKKHIEGAVSIPAGDRSAIHIDANIMLVDSNLRAEYNNAERNSSMIVYDDIGADSAYVIKVLRYALFDSLDVKLLHFIIIVELGFNTCWF